MCVLGDVLLSVASVVSGLLIDVVVVSFVAVRCSCLLSVVTFCSPQRVFACVCLCC